MCRLVLSDVQFVGFQGGICLHWLPQTVKYVLVDGDVAVVALLTSTASAPVTSTPLPVPAPWRAGVERGQPVRHREGRGVSGRKWEAWCRGCRSSEYWHAGGPTPK